MKGGPTGEEGKGTHFEFYPAYLSPPPALASIVPSTLAAGHGGHWSTLPKNDCCLALTDYLPSRNGFAERSAPKVVGSPKSFKKFEVTDKFHLCDWTVWCVPDIRVGERRLQVAIIDQAHALLAHLGVWKTLCYLCEHVCQWCRMRRRFIHLLYQA